MKKIFFAIPLALILGGCAPSQGEIDLAMYAVYQKGKTDRFIIQQDQNRDTGQFPQGSGEIPCDLICAEECTQDCLDQCPGDPICPGDTGQNFDIAIKTPKSMSSTVTAKGDSYVIQGSSNVSVQVGPKAIDPVQQAKADLLTYHPPGLRTWDQKFNTVTAPFISPLVSLGKIIIGGEVLKTFIQRPHTDQYNLTGSDFGTSGHLQDSANPISVEEVIP